MPHIKLSNIAILTPVYRNDNFKRYLKPRVSRDLMRVEACRVQV